MSQSGRIKSALIGLSLIVLPLSFAVPQKTLAADLFTDMMGGPHNWSGLYVGGQVGYAWGDVKMVFPGPITFSSFDPEGVLGGGHAGYNWQVQDVVFGIVGDFNFSDVDGTQFIPVSTGEVEMDFSASIRGKVGLALDRFLVYATAGAAVADVDHQFHTAAGTLNQPNNLHTGWTAGAGVEWAFNDWISAFVEYRHTFLSDESFPTLPTVTGHTLDFDYGQVQGGISFKIGDWLNRAN